MLSPTEWGAIGGVLGAVLTVLIRDGGSFLLNRRKLLTDEQKAERSEMASGYERTIAIIQTELVRVREVQAETQLRHGNELKAMREDYDAKFAKVNREHVECLKKEMRNRSIIENLRGEIKTLRERLP